MDDLISKLDVAFGMIGAPLCSSWMQGGIRHLSRNVGVCCFTSCQDDEDHECRSPEPYSGSSIAAIVNAYPTLVDKIRNLEATVARLRESHAIVKAKPEQDQTQ